ncbi:putative toxin-antitoxin system, antitoxin component [Syntrophobacter sp. SbD2]|nr:putative toxin-antitoxin system, antitoxin component [Syntrophobacter sp. SbD2]
MMDKELVSRKLSQLRMYVDELRRAEDINWEKYRSDLRARAFVERYIHLAIEEVIDVANHLVSFYQWREPTSFRDLFSILREHDVIPEAHLLTFQRMASFRNMLVHGYESKDDELVFGIFSKHLRDFDLFILLVTDWSGDHS